MSQTDAIDIKYGKWLSHVNAGIRVELRADIRDLPDVRIRDYYDDELTPSQAVTAIIDELYEAGELPIDFVIPDRTVLPGVELRNGATVVHCTELEYDHGVLLAVRRQSPHPWVVWDYRPGNLGSTGGGDYCDTLDQALKIYTSRGGQA